MNLRLVAFDMEGTLTADPTLWEIMHRKLGKWESHGLVYWERYCAGEMPYDEFAALDVAVWKGAPERTLLEAAEETPLMPGCADLLDGLRSRGVACVIVSNGLACLGERLMREHSVARVYANRHRARGGTLTGEIDIRVPYVAKGQVLARAMKEFGAKPEETAAVGDGEADAAMFAAAGLGVAFRPSDPRAVAGAAHVVPTGDLLEVGRILAGHGR